MKSQNRSTKLSESPKRSTKFQKKWSTKSAVDSNHWVKTWFESILQIVFWVMSKVNQIFGKSFLVMSWFEPIVVKPLWVRSWVESKLNETWDESNKKLSRNHVWYLLYPQAAEKRFQFFQTGENSQRIWQLGSGSKSMNTSYNSLTALHSFYKRNAWYLMKKWKSDLLTTGTV